MEVKEKPLKSSLGSPIGLSTSSFSMNFLESKSSQQCLQGFATILIAYGEYFITPEIEWDEQVINRILLEGQQLYSDSKAELSVGEELKEMTIKRSFKLCENTFNMMVQDPFLIGCVKGNELPVPNLHWGLFKFFKKYNFCLLQIGSWYTLIWKNTGVYFVFDCFGRRNQDLQRDRKQGKAMLICLRSLDNVSHLVMNLSSVQPEQVFTIRQLTIKVLIPCGGRPSPGIIDRSMKFEIISPDYALLRGTIHLGSKCFKEISNRQSLPVAICALLNAKIDPTPTWNDAIVDKIIKLGAQLYKQLTRCDVSLDLGIQDVPNWIDFGQFRIKIAVSTGSDCGLWKCTPNYKSSELTLALKEAFECGSNLLIQIQGRTYAIWKKKAFYYIMDPYSHQRSVESKKLVTASVRMCGTFDRLCYTITQTLLDIFEESKFLIHLLRIVQVEEIDTVTGRMCIYQDPCKCHSTSPDDCTHEVASLNESVTGLDDFVCAKESSPVESDSADLDSPGLSQTYLEDYTDLRRDFAEESSEESEEEEDESDFDENAISLDTPTSDQSDKDDDDEASASRTAKDKRQKKKSKKGSKGDKNSKTGGSGSHTKEGSDRKRGDETGDDDADDEMEKEQPKRKDTRKKKKKMEDNDGGGKGSKNAEVNSAVDGGKGKDKPSPTSKENADVEKGKDKVNKGDDAGTVDKQIGKKDKSPDRTTNAENEISNQYQEKDGKVNNKLDEDGKLDKTTNKDEEADKSSEKDTNIDPITENAEKSVEKEKVTPTEAQTFNKPDSTDQDKSKSYENKNLTPMDQDIPADESKSNGERTIENRETAEVHKPTKTTFRRQGHQRRKAQDGDDTSSDERPCAHIPAGCKPNCYPGSTEDSQDLAVVGSESESYETLCDLLKSAFRCADRVLTMTPWGNYVAFHFNRVYFIFDGCTCNLRSIRHMDLSTGTAGLLCFPDMHSLIRYIERGKEAPRQRTASKSNLVDQICSEYCREK